MKNKEAAERIALISAAILVVIGIVVLINNFHTDGGKDVVCVGAVCIGAADDKGWNQSHYEGIRKACEANACRMYSKMNIPEEEGALKKAVSELVDQGCSCIFLTS